MNNQPLDLKNYKAASADQLPEHITKLKGEARKNQQRITLATGVFDVFHQEHRNFLNSAKQLGGVLLVGIESDFRVRQLKGEGRPINNELARVKQLESISAVDGVFILPEQFSKPEDHKSLITAIKPDYFAVSSHSSHLEKKRKIVEDCGGELKIVLAHNPEISTTQILESDGGGGHLGDADNAA